MGLPVLKRKVADAISIACDVLGLIAGASGAMAVAFFGKLAAAVVLGAIALGFFLRLTSRRRAAPLVPRAVVPTWAQALSAVLASASVAALVEATNLPVRFNQPGFESWHWALVGAALAVAHSLFSRGISTLLRKGHASAPQP